MNLYYLHMCKQTNSIIDFTEGNRFRLTDVVDGASAELAVELLGTKAPEVVNGEGPEVEHIVPGEGVSLLDHHHLTA